MACLCFWQNSFSCLTSTVHTSDIAYITDTIHHPFFFNVSHTLCAYWLLSTRVCLPQKVVASQYSVLRNFDPRVFAYTIPRSMWHTFTQAASYTLLLVSVVITSHQLHLVCISCFKIRSTTYEILFFSSYITDIHSIAALAFDEWACLYPVIKADVRNPKTWFYDEIVFFNRRIPFFLLWGSISLDLSRKR